MRIGIDARELCGQATGVGRYLEGLLTAWAADERCRRHEFVLYASGPIPQPLDCRRFLSRTIPGPAGSWWEQMRLPRAACKDHLDVFFAPAYSAPNLGDIPVVVAIHDISFSAHPEWFGVREGARRRLLSRRSARHARAVVTISEFSKRELVERFGLDGDRVHVIPPGVTSPLRACVKPEAPTPPAAHTVLYVGSIFNRRHVPDLVRAFAPIARGHGDAALEIVGDNRSHPHQHLPRTIALEGLTGRARWRRWVPESELCALYRSARAFAFLSEYEGLGLTPLEALAAGVPPVLLDTPVARESCGKAALYVGSGDLAGTTRALEMLLFDEAGRKGLLAEAPATLGRYSWARAAHDTLSLLERCAS